MSVRFDTPEDLLSLLGARMPDMQRRFGVRRIGLFGSWARGEATPESDVDLLVEFDDVDFDKYMDLKFHLEELLGKSVDLLTPGSLRPILRQYVMQEIRYAA